MGWSVGHNGKRWVGYGVPAKCDYKTCNTMIDRGFGYVCEGAWDVVGEADVGDDSCDGDLYFCGEHSYHLDHKNFSEEKGESYKWLHHMMTDESWKKWREEDPRYSKYLYEYRKRSECLALDELE